MDGRKDKFNIQTHRKVYSSTHAGTIRQTGGQVDVKTERWVGGQTNEQTPTR